MMLKQEEFDEFVDSIGDNEQILQLPRQRGRKEFLHRWSARSHSPLASSSHSNPHSYSPSLRKQRRVDYTEHPPHETENPDKDMPTPDSLRDRSASPELGVGTCLMPAPGPTPPPPANTTDVWGGKQIVTDPRFFRFPKPDKSQSKNVIGDVPGVPVGFIFYCRNEARWSGVHRLSVGGIQWDHVCAYACVLNGGYEDDVDLGDAFVLTGSGGREQNTNRCAGPQTSNQELSRATLSLTKNKDLGHPVRVLRGHKLNSPYAPKRGFRYDGLYSVLDYQLQQGREGYMVYRFYMERCPGQAPAPWAINLRV